jgi:hypothetical protein
MAKALRIAVAARTGITTLVPEVRVVSYLPSPDEQMPDAIVIGYMSADADENQRAHAGGPRFDEEVNLISRVQVTRPGAGQDVADAVRLRAQALLAEVDDEVRDNLPTVGDQSWAGKVTERESVVIATVRENVGAMLCAVDFTIQYKARTS